MSLYFKNLIQSCSAVAHIIHRAHLVPFLHTVPRCINLRKPDKAAASEVQRTDVAAEQRRTLLSAATLYMVVRDAVFASGGGECSHTLILEKYHYRFNIVLQ